MGTTGIIIGNRRVGTRKKYLVAGIAIYGKESDGNAKTIVRVHQRVDRIEQSIKTVKGVGTFIVTALTGLGAWLGLVSNK